MMQIPNGAWSNFLILGLKFTPWMLGIMFIIATVFSWLGKARGREGGREGGRKGHVIIARQLVLLAQDVFWRVWRSVSHLIDLLTLAR